MQLNTYKLFTCSWRAGPPARPPCLPAWLLGLLDAVWAWMQSSHQSLLTWPCDGVPDITAAVIPGGRTTQLLTSLRLKKLCVWVCILSIWLSVCLLLRHFNNKRPISFLPNTEAFAWCALKAFTCSVGWKCGQTLRPVPRLYTLTYTPPHLRSSRPHLSLIQRNKPMEPERGRSTMSTQIMRQTDGINRLGLSQQHITTEAKTTKSVQWFTDQCYES